MVEPVQLYYGPLVDRKTAKANGLARYFTGKPCKHGHIEERATSAGGCLACVRLLARVKNGVVGPDCGTRITIRNDFDRHKAQLPLVFEFD